MDRIYLEKIREGDTEAFSYFVEKYSSRSYSLVLSIVKNEALAEEIVQVSFVKAYRGLTGFREDAKFSTWFYRILVNECNQAYRKRKMKNLDEKQELLNDRDTDADHEIAKKEKKQILELAIGHLKPREAMAIRLYYLCEMDHEEIAEVTGLSIANSKVILHRARKSLKNILETQFANEIHALK